MKRRSVSEALAQEDPGDTAAQRELASNYLLGKLHHGAREHSGTADRVRQKSSGNQREIGARAAWEPGRSSFAGQGLHEHGLWAGHGGPLVGRCRHYRKALPIRERLAADSPNNTTAQRDLANVYYRMGVMETQSGRPAAALPDLSSALVTQERILRTDKYDEQLRSDMASTRHFLGTALGATCDLPQA